MVKEDVTIYVWLLISIKARITIKDTKHVPIYLLAHSVCFFVFGISKYPWVITFLLPSHTNLLNNVSVVMTKDSDRYIYSICRIKFYITKRKFYITININLSGNQNMIILSSTIFVICNNTCQIKMCLYGKIIDISRGKAPPRKIYFP